MADLFSGLLALVLLIGALAVMLRGARGGDGSARSLGDLARYSMDRSRWAVALLAGLALGEIARVLDPSSASGNAFALGGLLLGLLAGAVVWALPFDLIGGAAAIIGSVAFVASGANPTDMMIRGTIVVALGLLFGLFTLSRTRPLGGITWFAALEVMTFLSGPLGISWIEIGGWRVGAVSLIGIGAAVALAFLPEIVLNLVAFAIMAMNVAAVGTGIIPDDPPGSWSRTIVILMATMGGYMLTSFLFRRVRR